MEAAPAAEVAAEAVKDVKEAPNDPALMILTLKSSPNSLLHLALSRSQARSHVGPNGPPPLSLLIQVMAMVLQWYR